MLCDGVRSRDATEMCKTQVWGGYKFDWKSQSCPFRGWEARFNGGWWSHLDLIFKPEEAGFGGCCLRVIPLGDRRMHQHRLYAQGELTWLVNRTSFSCTKEEVLWGTTLVNIEGLPFSTCCLYFASTWGIFPLYRRVYFLNVTLYHTVNSILFCFHYHSYVNINNSFKLEWRLSLPSWFIYLLLLYAIFSNFHNNYSLNSLNSLPH